jgi:hypothetical protein
MANTINNRELLNAIRTEHALFEAKIENLIRNEEAKVIIDDIDASTYKGCVYELAKTFDGPFRSSDLYVFGDALAAKYPNYNRNGAFGDNIENNIRGALSVLNNKDHLIENVGNYNYMVIGNKVKSKGVIYEAVN